MAVGLNSKITKLKIIIVTGQKDDGTDKTAERVFGNVNPNTTNADMLEIAQMIGNMQEYETNGFIRVEQGYLANQPDE